MNKSGGDATNTGTADEILDIVAKETGVDRARLQPGVTLNSLDIASLDMVQAIFALEERFGVEIPVVADQGSGEFETVGALVTHVQAAIGRATA